MVHGEAMNDEVRNLAIRRVCDALHGIQVGLGHGWDLGRLALLGSMEVHLDRHGPLEALEAERAHLSRSFGAKARLIRSEVRGLLAEEPAAPNEDRDHMILVAHQPGFVEASTD